MALLILLHRRAPPPPARLQYARMSATARSGAAKAAARALLKLAQDCGSVDDITVVVTVFAWGAASSGGSASAAGTAPRGT